MKRYAFLLVPALLLGCASNETTQASTCGENCAQCKDGAPCDRDGQDSAPASVKLSEKYAKMDPADAAQRGPNGIGDARDVFHELLAQHDKIKRTVEDIPGGVRTVTTSDDPEIAGLIRLHVRQMAARYEAGMPVRKWDPLFVELLKHFDKITMTMEDVPGGLRVIETSDDPQVALLIRQHAHRGVSEFVERGFDRAHEASPLPEGYGK
jgi:hypothetical protein